MIPLYLDILLKINCAKLFGKISVIEKHGINTIPYRNIVINTKNHHNNLIGKVECSDFNFYYIPLKYIEDYEQKEIGIEIYSTISICPFCFGIYLDIEEQYKYYKMMKEKEIDINNSNISDNIYKLLKDYFCFSKKTCFLRAPSF